jgi:two-component system NarL family sensor kinase
VRRATFPESGEAIAEAERVVAWLRIPVIALVALGQSLEHPNRETTAFAVMLAAFAVWSVSILAWVYVRPAGPRLALAATGVDIVAISVLAVLSGGAFSNARLALFLVPVAAAFRFRPWVTAVATVVTVGAYVTQAVTHPSRGEPEAARFILTQAGFLAWIGVACVLLSLALARRTEEVAQLGEARSRLLEDVQDAELRERRVLAEALHDHAIQNLLSARHELEEVADELPASTPLERADSAIAETVGQLRDAVFELHPYVLDQAGLEAAVRSVAQRAASRAGLELRLELRYPHRHPQDQLLFSAARELLANVVRHADARTVAVRLVEEGGSATLVVEDDGRGFPEGLPAERLADGHVGLASQRFRVEAAGGTMLVASGPDQGTRTEIRVPLSHVTTGA